MKDISTRETILVPAALCATMLLVGLVVGQLAGVDWTRLPGAYLGAAFGATVLALLLSIFCWVAVMAWNDVDKPVHQVVVNCKACVPALILPAVVLPLFLAGFTASKTAIPFLVGFSWDSTFADLDRILLGDDAWRITHAWLGSNWLNLWEWTYTFGWGAVFLVGSALVAINASRRRAAVFFTAMLLTWTAGGFLVAYAFSAAGPVFAHLVEPSLGPRFADLRETLAGRLAPDSLLRTTQIYLANSLSDHRAYRGGGISAMPSMHLGAASIYVLAARRTAWFCPAVLFWLTIFVLSAYFGYHYWIDAIPAAAIAWASWTAAETYYRDPAPVPSAPQLSPA